MKILMVYCNTPQDNAVPVGITQLISCLKEKGHNVELFDTTFYRQGFKSSAELRSEVLQYKPCTYSYLPSDMYEDFKAKIIDFGPDIIGFSVCEVTFNLFRKLLSSIQTIIRERSLKVAVGGAHAVFWPESVAKIQDVDFISVGEAEQTFPELCEKLTKGQEYHTQSGFWVRQGDAWQKNGFTGIVDLNSLPFLEQSVFGERFLMKPMMGKYRKTVVIELSRGCPYKCTYCAEAFLAEKFGHLGKWYRLKSINKIEEEYAQLIDKHKPEFVYKHSDTLFAAGKKWLNEYFEVYKKYRLPFWTESRPETVNKENIKQLADMNCARFSIGLESGDEEYRKKWLNRRYSNKQVLDAAKIIRKNGISFSMNLIIGFPFETREMIFEGIKILREARPDSISTFIFTPYKGCVLRSVCEEHNMIDEDFVGDDYFQMKYHLRNNTIGNEAVGLWRTVPLYVHLPESKYKYIVQAEKTDRDGDKMFLELKKEYYEIMGW